MSTTTTTTIAVANVWIIIFAVVVVFVYIVIIIKLFKFDFNFVFIFSLSFYTGTTTCPTLRARVENPLLPSGPIGVLTKFSLLFDIRKLLLRDRGDVPYSFIDAFENLRSYPESTEILRKCGSVPFEYFRGTESNVPEIFRWCSQPPLLPIDILRSQSLSNEMRRFPSEPFDMRRCS